MDKVCIICPHHGIFWQEVRVHLAGHQCPKCKTSKGENAVRKYLDLYNIEYKYEYIVKIKDKKRRFDFFLYNNNIVIEFQGQHHFHPVKHYSQKPGIDIKLLNYTKQSDQDKKEYCVINNLKFREVHYWQLKYIDQVLDAMIPIEIRFAKEWGGFYGYK